MSVGELEVMEERGEGKIKKEKKGKG